MKYHRLCYNNQYDYSRQRPSLAQAGAVGHDVAAGGAVEAGQGLGLRVRGLGDH